MLFIGTEKETLYFGTRNSIHLNEKYLVYTTRERSVIWKKKEPFYRNKYILFIDLYTALY